jgi:hypothetical protein
LYQNEWHNGSKAQRRNGLVFDIDFIVPLCRYIVEPLSHCAVAPLQKKQEELNE